MPYLNTSKLYMTTQLGVLGSRLESSVDYDFQVRLHFCIMFPLYLLPTCQRVILTGCLEKETQGPATLSDSTFGHNFNMTRNHSLSLMKSPDTIVGVHDKDRHEMPQAFYQIWVCSYLRESSVIENNVHPPELPSLWGSKSRVSRRASGVIPL